MPFLGQPRQRLIDALNSGFQDFDAVNRLATNVLGIQLLQRTNPLAGLEKNIDVLITICDERDDLPRLVAAARAERPNNAALRRVEQEFALTFDPYMDVQAPADRPDVKKVGVERVIVAAAGFPSADAFLSRLAAAEFRVCAISYETLDGRSVCGTGFLIADDLLMTNVHVVEKACDAALTPVLAGREIKVRFDYRAPGGRTSDYTLAAEDWLVAFGSQMEAGGERGLDYAVLRLEKRAGEEPIGPAGASTARGFFPLVNATPAENEPVLILQHPWDVLGGEQSPMRLTIGFARTGLDAPPVDIQHTANTSEGSSGAPVFNSRMEVIGLHYWGGQHFNGAKKIGAIKQHLAAQAVVLS